MNILKRLPDNWNSIKLRDAQISWSLNAGSTSSRFEGGATPAFEEVLPYFRRFIDETDRGYLSVWMFLRKARVRFHNSMFGQFQQALCISGTPKGCANKPATRPMDREG